MDIMDTAQRYDGVNSLVDPQISRSRPTQSRQSPPAETKRPGDSVSLSTSAQELSRILGKSTGKTVSGDEQEADPVVRLQKRIKELEEKISKVEQSAIPDETKQPVVEGLQKQLAELNQQLAELTSPKGASGMAGIVGNLASANKVCAKA